jgi:hypothetical protein
MAEECDTSAAAVAAAVGGDIDSAVVERGTAEESTQLRQQKRQKQIRVGSLGQRNTAAHKLERAGKQ